MYYSGLVSYVSYQPDPTNAFGEVYKISELKVGDTIESKFVFVVHKDAIQAYHTAIIMNVLGDSQFLLDYNHLFDVSSLIQ